MNEICKEAIETFGIEAQKRMLIEECGELLTAIAQEFRNRTNKEDIITELADVSIMVEQMAIAYGYDDFQTEQNIKLLRLKERINKHKLKQ